MAGNPTPDDLVALLHAISDDNSLRERLLSLEQFPLALRQATLWRIADQMRSAGEDESVISAISALVQPRNYRAACDTLRELHS